MLDDLVIGISGYAGGTGWWLARCKLLGLGGYVCRSGIIDDELVIAESGQILHDRVINGDAIITLLNYGSFLPRGDGGSQTLDEVWLTEGRASPTLTSIAS